MNDVSGSIAATSRIGDWSRFTQDFEISLRNIHEALSSSDDGRYDDALALFNYLKQDIKKITKVEVQFQSEFRSMLEKLGRSSELNFLIILMIYHRSYQVWEDTLYHDQIRQVIQETVGYYRMHADISPRLEEQKLFGAFFDLFKLLNLGMRIENSLNINCALGVQRA